VLGAVAIAALDLGIVQRGVDNGGAEIVEDDTARDSAEELEGGPMQAQPRRHRLVEHQLGVLMATAGQRHDEDPGAPDAPPLRIQELAGEAEVDLRLRAGVHLEPERRLGQRRGGAPQKAFHRRVATGKALLLDQELPDGLPLHAARVQGEHTLA
jgi:hypothetical protein